MSPRTLLGTAFALLAFAANSLLCRAALAHGAIGPMPFTAVRLASGAIVLLLLGPLAHRRAVRPDLTGALALLLYAAPFALAYVRLSAGTGALLLFGAVQLTILGVALLRGERLGALEWFGLVLALAGLVLLVRPGLSAPPLVSAALMVVAGAAWGVYTLRGRGAPDALGRTAANFALATPGAFLALALPVGPAPPIAPSGFVLAAISGAITSGLGYAAWYAALPALSRARAGIVQLSVPAIAALGGVAFLGEHVSVRLAGSAALILGGVALATLVRAPAPPSSVEARA